jgi:hypothetical protein
MTAAMAGAHRARAVEPRDETGPSTGPCQVAGQRSAHWPFWVFLGLSVEDLRRQPDYGGGGEWVPNKIPERNLACPKLTQRASLLTRSRPHNYRQAIGPRNRVRENEISAEAQTVQANPRQNYGEPKSDQQSFSQPHIHFIEHLTCLTEKPLEEHNEH